MLYNSLISAHDYRGVLGNFFSPKTAEHRKSSSEWTSKLRGRDLEFHSKDLKRSRFTAIWNESGLQRMWLWGKRVEGERKALVIEILWEMKSLISLLFS